MTDLRRTRRSVPGNSTKQKVWGGVAGLLIWLVLAASPAGAYIVTINEIMYHPNDAQGDIEYIELYNSTPVDRDLSGWYFSDGIDYVIPDGTWIQTGGYLVIVSSPTVFAAQYPSVPYIGPYTGRLDNAGERVELRNKVGGLIDMVDYNDRGRWPVAADGTGHSLSLTNIYDSNSDPDPWAISAQIGGTPGAANFVSPPASSPIVINELMCNSAAGTWIELRNLSSAPVDVNGRYLSDNRNMLNKYQIAGQPLLPGGGLLVIPDTTLGFLLKPTGGRLYLTNAALNHVDDAVDYEGTALDHSRGLYFDRRNHQERWYYMTTPTPWAANTATINDQIVINEIMYHTLIEDKNREYVEIYNRGGSPVDLTGWKFTNGIRYDFTTGTTIAGGGYLVLAEAPTTITSIYGIAPSLVVGPTSGTLNDDRDRLVLVDNLGNVADEVRYYDGGRWPEWADGGGSSLELINPDQSNDFPSAWAASDDSAKAVWTQIDYTKAQVPAGVPNVENEFHLMLIDDGVCVVDDLGMVRTAAPGTPVLTNGNFESGTAPWLFQGTHSASAIVAGIGRSNSRGLRVEADGRGTEGPNHVEQDTAVGLFSGADYRVTGWAKWVVGCPQLLTRTHYQGVAQTTELQVPQNLGTPGAQNSRYQANLGPVIHEVGHTPVTPSSTQNVTVTALVLDAQAVSNVTLYYKRDTAAGWTSIPMQDNGLNGDGAAGDDVYGAVIPNSAHNNNDIIEFYVRATDAAAWWSTFPASNPPAAPPSKSAMYRVRDGSRGTSLKMFEMILNDDVVADLPNYTTRMDNSMRDATFVIDDARAYYNIRWRYRGSGYTRSYGLDGRPNYRLRFNSDEPLFDLISVNVDNQRGGGDCGRNDRMVQWLMYELGVPVPIHEYVRMWRHCTSAPDANHGVYDHVKRIDGAFIDMYYPDGDDGYLHKVDDHFEWSDGGDRRRRSPDDTARLKYYGDDEELYRWNLKPRSWESQDNFNPLINMIKFMDPDVTNDATWEASVENWLDVEEWLKKLACSAVCDDWDTLGMEHGGDPRGKNSYVYQRSDNGQWILIPWDNDLVFNTATRALYPNFWFDSCRRLMTYGKFNRMYLSYITELVYGPFSTLEWNDQLDRFEAVLIAEGDFYNCSAGNRSKPRDFQAARLPWLLGQLPAGVTYEITSNGGNDFAVDTPTVDIMGRGGLTVQSFRVNGAPTTDTTWLDQETWLVRNIPLNLGPNPLTITGHNSSGVQVGTDSITVTRYASLRSIPYGTGFEPDGAPPFGLGPLPENLWTGRGDIQNSIVYEGQQALRVQDGFAEHEFLGAGHNIVWVESYIQTAGSPETASTPDDAGEFAAQLYFNSTQGILALDGDGVGGGSWTATGINLSATRFIRVGIKLDYTAQRWDLYIDGTPVLTNLGFAFPKPQLNWFRYYSDVVGTMDLFSVTGTPTGVAGMEIKRWQLY